MIVMEIAGPKLESDWERDLDWNLGNNFAKNTIVIEVAVSEKNSSENVLKSHELTTLATTDDRQRCRTTQLYVAKRDARPAVIRIAVQWRFSFEIRRTGNAKNVDRSQISLECCNQALENQKYPFSAMTPATKEERGVTSEEFEKAESVAVYILSNLFFCLKFKAHD
ncbi:hypothetical protein EVAR_92149_1 [Eumeta japonica]|uniref:Uncharacterized protein n=1 Tax=Eumeta variegata TaxID=151549 RepID=A0A4C1T1E0_EUMVA|nr:hypothetical protein EVAR_92149_1 [Eumeta japonica]